FQQPVEQRGLAGAKEAGEDGEGDRFRRPSPGSVAGIRHCATAAGFGLVFLAAAVLVVLACAALACAVLPCAAGLAVSADCVSAGAAFATCLALRFVFTAVATGAASG